MRVFFKILLFPISLLFSMIIAIFGFVIGHTCRLLSVISFVLFSLGVITLLLSLHDGSRYGMQSAIIAGVTAFIISPYGLPLLVEWLIGKLVNLNDTIKSI